MKEVRRSARSKVAKPVSRVYEWGHSVSKRLSPELVSLDQSEDVVQLACNRRSSFALLRGGQVLFWGNSYAGQSDEVAPCCCIFIVLTFSSQLVPIPVLPSLKVSRLVAGRNHGFCLAEKVVWAFGSDMLGSSGKGGVVDVDSGSEAGDEKIMSAPSRVKIPGEVEDVADGAYDHGLALTTEGLAYTWGLNIQG